MTLTGNKCSKCSKYIPHPLEGRRFAGVPARETSGYRCDGCNTRICYVCSGDPRPDPFRDTDNLPDVICPRCGKNGMILGGIPTIVTDSDLMGSAGSSASASRFPWGLIVLAIAGVATWYALSR